MPANSVMNAYFRAIQTRLTLELLALYGTWWCTGLVEMSDALLSERKHRYNQKINERKHLGFPKLGHYDTWKIDALLLLVEKTNGVLLYQ